MSKTPHLFESIPFAKGLTLRNRVMMAPMTTWAANDDGTVSDDEVAYYRRRADGPGLVLTGCSRVTDNGIGFTGEFASYDDRFLPSLKCQAEAAKSGGAPAVLQIYHAGNKAVPELSPNGEIVSASAISAPPGPFNSGAVIPRALDSDEILAIIADFGRATRRAIEAGFDGIELHGAHGFLIQNFFSPLFNQRGDEWGGSLDNRMRFPLAVVAEVKRVIDSQARRPFVLGYRMSPEESENGGLRIEDTYELIERLIDGGIDYIHASLSNALEARPVGQTDGATVAAMIVGRVAGRVPVVAAGQIRTPEQAQRAIEAGLTLVAIGQGLVMNPEWVTLAQGDDKAIQITLDPARIVDIALPAKLWSIIQATTGWFTLLAETPSFSQTVRQRRSFRDFLPLPVPANVIREVLDEAQLAPSNCNTQPWHLHIVSGAKRDQLSDALHAADNAGRYTPDFSWDVEAFKGRYGDRHRDQGRAYYTSLGITRDDTDGRRRAAALNYSFYQAPHVALLFMPVVGDSVRVAADVGMYAQTFLLSLTAHGLGGVPQTVLGFYVETVRETLGIPGDFKMLFGISFGYPNEDSPANKSRMGRVAFSENVTFHD